MDPTDRARPSLLSPHQSRPEVSDPLVSSLLSRCRFPAEGELDLAVSGGPDSTAMTVLTAAAGHRAVLHHVDHGLRPGSDDEQERVRELARAWGFGFVGHRVELEAGSDLERRCREARLSVLPPGTLFGHTADDLAETVVMRVMRGTGPAGLAAMSERTHPLLRLRRAETVALCGHLGLAPVEDPMNRDPRFTRNRVRSEVLPLMCEVAGRDVVPLLCRLAQQAGEQASAVTGLLEDLDPTDATALASAPGWLARESLRRWWREDTGLLGPDAASLERMLGVARTESRACDVLAGWRLERTAGRLRLAPPLPPGSS